MIFLVETAKQFFSATETNVRMAYGRHPTRYLRQSVFFGSTNVPDFLKDQSGNRRFWPIEVRVDQIDTARLKAEVQLIWAEAVQMYLEMRAEKPYGDLPLHLTDPEAQVEAASYQSQALRPTEADAVAEQLSEILHQKVAQGDEFDQATGAVKWARVKETSPYALKQALDNDRISVQLIAKALQKLGWHKTGAKKRAPGQKNATAVYVPGEKQLAEWAEMDAEAEAEDLA